MSALSYPVISLVETRDVNVGVQSQRAILNTLLVST